MRRMHPASVLTKLCDLQDVLEKFEFFPIKCRVQRTVEISQIQKMQGNPCRFKTQVYTFKSPQEHRINSLLADPLKIRMHILGEFLVSESILTQIFSKDTSIDHVSSSEKPFLSL